MRLPDRIVPEYQPFGRSRFTAPAIASWLAARTRLVQKRRKSEGRPSRRKPDPTPRPVTGATRRKYLAAAASFGAYLREIGVITSNPARDVDAPPPSRPRVVEIELRDVLRIVDGTQPPFRALFALLYGAGVEVSAALACTEGDVDMQRREVRARGTKAHTRDRVVRVAEWAWPHLERHLQTLTPGERLFRGINRWDVGDAHRERIRVLGLPPPRARRPALLRDSCSQGGHAVRACGAPARTRRRDNGRSCVRPLRTAQRRTRSVGADRRSTGCRTERESRRNGYRGGYLT